AAVSYGESAVTQAGDQTRTGAVGIVVIAVLVTSRAAVHRSAILVPSGLDPRLGAYPVLVLPPFAGVNTHDVVRGPRILSVHLRKIGVGIAHLAADVGVKV